MKQIPLSKGKFALVDDADFDYLNQWKWFVRPSTGGSEYAMRRTKTKGKVTMIFMHRFILGLTDSMTYVDHINHDGLDNQRANIRACTPSQNAMNRSNGFGWSKFKGVGKNISTAPNKWTSRIKINKKYNHLGYFKTEEEAAKRYNEEAIKLFDEFACLNQV